jgi:hydroxyethylthiazole kinase
MAHMQSEVAEMVQLASALVLNIGTLNAETVASMLKAGKAANKKGIPIVLDMVGCGATTVRSQTIQQLLDSLRIAIIKGNAAETGAAAGAEAVVKGVESISVSGDPEEIASQLARGAGAIVVVTGPEDIVTDGQSVHLCQKGHPLMGQVVGTGCMAASVLGCFAAASDDYFEAAVCAVNFYGTAGTQAAQKAATPMAFKLALLDTIYEMANAEAK